VAALLQLHEGGSGGLRHVGLFHGEVAAHVHDRGDVLDEDRALLHARAAGDAVPDLLEAYALDEWGDAVPVPVAVRRRLGDRGGRVLGGGETAGFLAAVDRLEEPRRGGLLVHEVADVDDDVLGREELTGEIGGTGVGAAAALGAAVGVE
jgi:hypothetical protein